MSGQRPAHQPEPPDADRFGKDGGGGLRLRRLDRGFCGAPRHRRREEMTVRALAPVLQSGERLRLRVRGVVQGVGFRPLRLRLGLASGV